MALIFGGNSTEHSVSVRSARAVMKAVDKQRFAIVPFGVTDTGVWLAPDQTRALLDAMEQGAPECVPAPDPAPASRLAGAVVDALAATDLAFPLIHGTTGEDGQIQGLLETLGLPYVGAGVTASAIAMDKAVAKRLFAASGLPVGPYVVARAEHWRRDPDELIRAAAGLEYPLFVKPSNGGSSVGVSKVDSREEIGAAVDEALRHDRTALIEQGIVGRELECSMLGNDAPEASPLGEAIPHRDFYDYIAKYEDPATELIVPAGADPDTVAEIQAMSIAAFEAIGCEGMARVDFLLDEVGRPWINEINTIPGFTSMSMYPQMWEAAGLPFPDLIGRLADLALERAKGASRGH